MDKKFGIKHVVAMGIGTALFVVLTNVQIPVGFIPNTALQTRAAVLAFFSAIFGPVVGGAIGLIEEGDEIEIDIPARRIHLKVSDDELKKRREKMEAKGTNAWKPLNRKRQVSKALQMYAAMATSADRGAVRDISR